RRDCRRRQGVRARSLSPSSARVVRSHRLTARPAVRRESLGRRERPRPAVLGRRAARPCRLCHRPIGLDVNLTLLPIRTFALVLAVLLVAVCAPRAAAPRPAPPKLAVIVMIDQKRADYVDHFKGDCSAGLTLPLSKRAWLRRPA